MKVFNLKLSTLNVRGLCEMGKNTWITFEIIRDYDLVGLSETKISEKQINSNKINPSTLYERYFERKTYWKYTKESPSSSSGTAFIYVKTLDSYLKSIETDNEGRAIMMRLKINIYI
jgi:exonuclease III